MPIRRAAASLPRAATGAGHAAAGGGEPQRRRPVEQRRVHDDRRHARGQRRAQQEPAGEHRAHARCDQHDVLRAGVAGVGDGGFEVLPLGRAQVVEAVGRGRRALVVAVRRQQDGQPGAVQRAEDAQPLLPRRAAAVHEHGPTRAARHQPRGHRPQRAGHLHVVVLDAQPGGRVAGEGVEADPDHLAGAQLADDRLQLTHRPGVVQLDDRAQPAVRALGVDAEDALAAEVVVLAGQRDRAVADGAHGDVVHAGVRHRLEQRGDQRSHAGCSRSSATSGRATSRNGTSVVPVPRETTSVVSPTRCVPSRYANSVCERRTLPFGPGQADLAAVQVAGQHQVAGAGRQVVDGVREVRQQDPQPGVRPEQPLGVGDAGRSTAAAPSRRSRSARRTARRWPTCPAAAAPAPPPSPRGSSPSRTGHGSGRCRGCRATRSCRAAAPGGPAARSPHGGRAGGRRCRR